MKSRTTISLSPEMLRALDSTAKAQNKSRSTLIENALATFLQPSASRDAKDLMIINRRAKKMNEEALDVLEYQVRL